MKIVVIVVTVIVAALAVVIVYGAQHWNAGTRELRARLDAARTRVTPRVVDFRELEGLPAPVQRYFRSVLKDGRPMVAAVRVRHVGTFNRGDKTDQWNPFTSDQQVITRRPGFDWDARMKMMPAERYGQG